MTASEGVMQHESKGPQEEPRDPPAIQHCKKNVQRAPPKHTSEAVLVLPGRANVGRRKSFTSPVEDDDDAAGW